MKLNFELTQEDILQFYKFHSWYSPDKKNFRIKNRLYAAAFLGIIPFVMLADRGFTLTHFLRSSIPGIAAFAFGFFATKPYILAVVERRVSKLFKDGRNQDMIEFRTMEFKDATIECSSKSSQTKVELDSIEKVRLDENYVYIYLNTVSAYIIPKRIFKSDDEFIRLRSFLKVQ